MAEQGTVTPCTLYGQLMARFSLFSVTALMLATCPLQSGVSGCGVNRYYAGGGRDGHNNAIIKLNVVWAARQSRSAGGGNLQWIWSLAAPGRQGVISVMLQEAPSLSPRSSPVQPSLPAPTKVREFREKNTFKCRLGLT